MKATVKQFAAGTFIALLLLVGNVNAKGTETVTTSTENMEVTLSMEAWMTDETIWNTTSINLADFVEETEAALELENWMTGAGSWSINFEIAQEVEAGLELENWMTNETTWNFISIEKELNLTIQPWMISKTIWK